MSSTPTLQTSGVRRLLPLAQGWLYVLSGAWPVVHLASFEAVTGASRRSTSWMRR